MSARPAETAFAYLHHLVTVPVRVAGSDARFVLDTGIGLTLVTDAFARTIGCEPGAATFSGRRMSGQEVTVPLADAPEIAVGGFARREPAVGVLDMHGFPSALEGVDGFLSLAFFESVPFTVDYGRSLLLFEDQRVAAHVDLDLGHPGSGQREREEGAERRAVTLEPQRDGRARSSPLVQRRGRLDDQEAPAVVHRDDAHDLWLAFFTDPDGCRLALMEERAR